MIPIFGSEQMKDTETPDSKPRFWQRSAETDHQKGKGKSAVIACKSTTYEPRSLVDCPLTIIDSSASSGESAIMTIATKRQQIASTPTELWQGKTTEACWETTPFATRYRSLIEQDMVSPVSNPCVFRNQFRKLKLYWKILKFKTMNFLNPIRIKFKIIIENLLCSCCKETWNNYHIF